MPRRLSFLAVEGQHDAAFLGRLLKDAGFQLIQRKEQNLKKPNKPYLESSLARLVPPNFPYDNDLLARVPVPFFWQNELHAIALRPANSDSKLISSAVAAISGVRPASFDAVGIVLDADDKGMPANRMTKLQRAVNEEEAKLGSSVGFTLPSSPGGVTTAVPRCGVFIMPDNTTAGTLEDLLLDCAGENYSELRTSAHQYVSEFDRAQLNGNDLDEIGAPAGEKKAWIGVIASILKPGKAIQNSLSDNRWLEGSAKTQPRIQVLRQFLRDLLDEPAI